MNQCPHCRDKAISHFAKVTSRPAEPAVCPNCGGRCHIASHSTLPGRIANLSVVAFPLLALGGLFVTGNLWAAVALVASIGITAYAVHVLALLNSPLVATSEEGVEDASRWLSAFALYVMVASTITVLVVLYRHHAP